MTVPEIHELFLNSKGVTIDSRKINPDTLFFALKGNHFDGNQFASKALNLGASYAIIDNADYLIDSRCILVSNVLETLQELAQYHRDFLNIKIIALTGSNGKTTTKELFHAVISQKYKCKSTFGNLNNHIGVPLTLLSFDDTTEIGVVEMGANHQKEIDFLCHLAKPDIGYITNFGKAHLEGFGGFEGVIKGKSEMYNFLKDKNKIALVNIDDHLQIEKSHDIGQRIEFSIKSLNIKIEKSSENDCLTFYMGDKAINTNLYGNYNLSNCLAAISLGLYLEIEIEKIIEGISGYVPENHRSQWIEKGSIKIVLDAYNANPTSMEHALNNFTLLDNQSKTVILGDMYELGKESEFEHKKIVSFLENNQKLNALLVGKEFFKHKRTIKNIVFFENIDDLVTHLKTKKILNGYILIKGSRAMKLENVLNIL